MFIRRLIACGSQLDIFLDAAIVNAYRIQYIYKQQEQANLHSQVAFREKLYQELFLFAAAAQSPRPNQQIEPRYHQRISLDRRMACMWCQYKREKSKKGQQAPRGKSGCGECGIAICIKGQRWDKFHSSD
jgi:hypothetical protein